jgi:hypothetical protein
MKPRKKTTQVKSIWNVIYMYDMSAPMFNQINCFQFKIGVLYAIIAQKQQLSGDFI